MRAAYIAWNPSLCFSSASRFPESGFDALLIVALCPSVSLLLPRHARRLGVVGRAAAGSGRGWICSAVSHEDEHCRRPRCSLCKRTAGPSPWAPVCAPAGDLKWRVVVAAL